MLIKWCNEVTIMEQELMQDAMTIEIVHHSCKYT